MTHDDTQYGLRFTVTDRGDLDSYRLRVESSARLYLDLPIRGRVNERRAELILRLAMCLFGYIGWQE